MKQSKLNLKQWSKCIFIFLLIIVLTGLVSMLYLSPKFPYTHDGENHLARFANYKIALKEGQFPPRFAPNLMNHYGYPVFNYNYPLANILSVPFSLLKLNYQLTFKILAVASLGFGLLGCWYWLKKIGVRSLNSVAMGLTSFATAPLVVSLFYHRGNIGEMLALSLLPWLFAELTITNKSRQEKSSVVKKIINLLFPIGLWTVFFLSHNVTVLFGSALLLTYFLLQLPSSTQLKNKVSSFLVGIGMSLWFWLPAIGEKSLVVLDNANLSVGFADHFTSINQLIFSPLSFGFSRIGSIDGLAVGAGLAGIVGFILVIIASIKSFIVAKPKKLSVQQRQVLVLTLLAFCCLFFQLSVTLPIWQFVPFAQFIQFPWRLSLFFVVIAVPLIAIVGEKIQSKATTLVIWLLLITQLVAVAHAKPVDYFSKNIIDYDLFSQSTSTLNENLPKQFTYESFSESWSPQPSILETSADTNITVLSWTGSKRSYQVRTSEKITIVEPSMNFAGWETFVEKEGNKEKAEYIDNQQIGGRIAYQLGPGEFTIQTKFTQNTFYRMLGNIISLVTSLSILGYTLLQVKKYRFR